MLLLHSLLLLVLLGLLWVVLVLLEHLWLLRLKLLGWVVPLCMLLVPLLVLVLMLVLLQLWWRQRL